MEIDFENWKPAYVDARIVSRKCELCGEYRDLEVSGDISTRKPCGDIDCPCFKDKQQKQVQTK